jgi:hypothetical protein
MHAVHHLETLPATNGEGFVFPGSDARVMVNELVLGSKPEKLKVNLVVGADVVTVIQRKDGLEWDPATDLYVEFDYGTEHPKDSFPATIDGLDARFEIDAIDVAGIIERKPKRARIWYELGELRLLWASGEVVVLT